MISDARGNNPTVLIRFGLAAVFLTGVFVVSAQMLV